MKRLVSGVVAAVLVGSLAAVSGAATATGERQARSAFVPTLNGWHGCGSLECSTLTVPLDYAHPDNGKTVKLAVSRLAADPGAGPYAGIMVLNFGGPGAGSLGGPFLRDSVPGTAAERYDWIGLDPRGVGSSVPAFHCTPNFFGPNRPNYNPTTKSLLRYWLNKSKAYGAACGRSAAKALLPFMTTRDNARDLESLRAALHDEATVLHQSAIDKLNLYGFSYGSYLGIVYASLFPAKVGRFVLDGVVSPARYWYGSNLDQDYGFERNINVFFTWIARHHAVYHLGTKGSQVRARYNAEVKRLDKTPAAGGKLGPDELEDALLGAGYYVFDWESIADAYARLIHRRQGYPLYAIYRSGNLGVEADNGIAVYEATTCTDQRRPTLATQLRDARRVNKAAPFSTWGGVWFNGPCLAWPAPSRGKVTPMASALNALGTKILLINETYDAATPYSGALNVRALFAGARLVEGYKGTTHAGSLFGVACVDNAVAAYLATGKVPARQPGRRSDLRCPPNPRPDPGRYSARRSAGGTTLREQIARDNIPRS